MNRPAPRCARKLGRRGFTLVEILIVLVVVAILFSLTASVSFSSLRSSRLSAEVKTLADEMTKASLESVRMNRSIHFRFYSFIDPVFNSTSAEIRAYQALILDADASAYVPLGAPKRLGDDLVIHRDLSASTILDLPEKTPVTTPATGVVLDPIIQGLGAYTYYDFQFRPDGSTSLPKDKTWGLVLAHDSDPAGTVTGSAVPDDYRSLTINPFTGAIKAY